MESPLLRDSNLIFLETSGPESIWQGKNIAWPYFNFFLHLRHWAGIWNLHLNYTLGGCAHCTLHCTVHTWQFQHLNIIISFEFIKLWRRLLSLLGGFFTSAPVSHNEDGADQEQNSSQHFHPRISEEWVLKRGKCLRGVVTLWLRVSVGQLVVRYSWIFTWGRCKKPFFRGKCTEDTNTLFGLRKSPDCSNNILIPDYSLTSGRGVPF